MPTVDHNNRASSNQSCTQRVTVPPLPGILFVASKLSCATFLVFSCAAIESCCAAKISAEKSDVLLWQPQKTMAKIIQVYLRIEASLLNFHLKAKTAPTSSSRQAPNKLILNGFHSSNLPVRSH
jgi:p-aminobenzoyl-glutamate transporter AbgT